MTPRNIPLHCSICPKKPDFSDVSHLLTHVASKGHLSHYYKVKVQSSQDETARERIDAYDQWYSDWNIEGLMSDRLTFKERRRSKRGGATAPAPRPVKKTYVPKTPLPRTPQVDPRLSYPQDRYQALQELKSEVNDPDYVHPFPMHFQRKIIRPRLHFWSTRRPTSFDAIPLEFSSPPIPLKLSMFPILPQPAPLARMFRNKQMSPLDDEPERSSEMTKLKGILWPGMDIFDAATTPMRRKRNQKKETSVVDRLEKNAAGVEANEMIFTPGGSLVKQRPITGQVDFDSSPYKSNQFLSSPPKKKVVPRIILASKDPNRMLRPVTRTSSSRRCEVPAVAADVESQVITGAKRNSKRKRDFAVLDEKPHEDEPTPSLNSGLPLLASEFDPDSNSGTLPSASAFSLEGPLAALYRPAFQQNYLAEAFEPYHQPMYGIPYQPFYSQIGYDIPGFFSNPVQHFEQRIFDFGELEIKRAVAEEPASQNPSID